MPSANRMGSIALIKASVNAGFPLEGPGKLELAELPEWNHAFWIDPCGPQMAGRGGSTSWRSMSRYRWTKRVLLSGLVIFGLWFLFAFVTRILGVVIAGVEPEAWVLTAMMTAPLAIGGVAVLAGGPAVVERLVRRG